MKREILFRGKEVVGKFWVYGSLLITDDNTNDCFGRKPITKRYQICQYEACDWNLGGWNFYDVLPETIGQYIGVKGYKGDYNTRHNNEVKLFEGDIVEAMSEGAKGTFIIKMRTECNPKWLLYPNYQSKKFWDISASQLGRKEGDYYDDLKIIGNIHDNPELING